VINQPKSVQHCINIVSKSTHAMDNDVEPITLMQPLIDNLSLVVIKGYPSLLIVLFFKFIGDFMNFKWLHSVHSFKSSVGWWKHD
jgi:hypothetical protein